MSAQRSAVPAIGVTCHPVAWRGQAMRAFHPNGMSVSICRNELADRPSGPHQWAVDLSSKPFSRDTVGRPA